MAYLITSEAPNEDEKYVSYESLLLTAKYEAKKLSRSYVAFGCVIRVRHVTWNHDKYSQFYCVASYRSGMPLHLTKR